MAIADLVKTTLGPKGMVRFTHASHAIQNSLEHMPG